ncbi:hypothetical protein [Fusobacterium mortiferum]|uniref:hypothetical protein n=1 Tax=Fusobacterium mortiferum TaxID=850 RepID=UPI003F8EFEF3
MLIEYPISSSLVLIYSSTSFSIFLTKFSNSIKLISLSSYIASNGPSEYDFTLPLE